MAELGDAQTIEEIDRVKSQYNIEKHQLYHISDIYSHVHYMTFTDAVDIDGFPNGLTPDDLSKSCPEAALIAYPDVYSSDLDENCRQVLFDLESPHKSGVLVIMPLDGLYLAGTASDRQSAISGTAIYRALPPEDAGLILLGCIHDAVLPEGLYFSDPMPVCVNGMERYRMDLVKETASHGEVILMSFEVDCLTYRVTSDHQTLEEEMLDLTPYRDPVEGERSFKKGSRSFPIDNCLSFSVEDHAIALNNQITGKSMMVPVPARIISNLKSFLQYFDLHQLFSLSMVSENADSEQIYALRAMFGRKADHWSGQSEITWFDIASLIMRYDEISGLPAQMDIRPQYSIQEAGERKGVTLVDLKIGPAAAAMEPDKFLEGLLADGAAESERKRLGDFFDKTDFGSFNYNGITAQYHGLADCITSISYEGSPQNYATPRGITVGSTREEVREAYGPPDCGLTETDVWFYLMDKPYWMTDDDHAKEPGKHYGDGLSFTFRDGRVDAIHCTLYISGS